MPRSPPGNLTPQASLVVCSGYEEAAAQGLLAGINAARHAQSLPLIALRRESSFIGTLLDDLATKVSHECSNTLWRF